MKVAGKMRMSSRVGKTDGDEDWELDGPEGAAYREKRFGSQQMERIV